MLKSLETSNYYYGARYYNPQTSVWLSVDPMSSQRPNLTPYNFVSNNPIMRVDPTGMLDHGYKVDGNGNISDKPVDNTGGDEFDVIYNEDMSQTSLPIESGILNSKRESFSGADHEGSYTADVLDASGMTNSKEVFEFLSENTDVEWSHTTMDHSQKGEKKWIATTHRGNNEMGGGHIIGRESKNYNLKEHVHSHPGETYPMPSPGDIDAAGKMENYFITPKMKIYLPETGEYKNYNSKSPSYTFPEIIIKPKR